MHLTCKIVMPNKTSNLVFLNDPIDSKAIHSLDSVLVFYPLHQFKIAIDFMKYGAKRLC